MFKVAFVRIAGVDAGDDRTAVVDVWQSRCQVGVQVDGGRPSDASSVCHEWYDVLPILAT